MKKTILTVVFAFAMAGPALAHQCPSLMQKIDDAMATTSIDDATKAQVTELYDKGKAAHEAGDHDASVADLNEALKLLGL